MHSMNNKIYQLFYADGSDETVRECISFQCGEDKYRCTYGACVNKTAECNNYKDCADNSGNMQIIIIFSIE